MSKVDIYKCKSYNEKDIEEVMNQIITSFDVFKKIKKGSKIVIKANLVSAMSPEKSATTHPMLLKVLTKILTNKGCEVVIGDSPSGLFNSAYLKHVYKVTNMDITGAKLNDNFNTKTVFYEKARVLKSFEYTEYLDTADFKINFCKLKSHAMMKMSSSVKNLFGTIPGTLKPQYHYRFPNPSDFANMLIDLNEYFNFDINIVDAIEGMEGNGPTMGDTKQIGLVLASENPYALDYIGAKIIGLDPMSVETIYQSSQRNLFDKDDFIVNANVDDLVIKNFKHNAKIDSLQFYSNSHNPLLKCVSYLSKKLFNKKPYCKKKKCIGCEKCYNMCPAKAISMVNGNPVIDRNKCIKCYCCQEFCPKGAMIVKTSLVNHASKKKQ